MRSDLKYICHDVSSLAGCCVSSRDIQYSKHNISQRIFAGASGFHPVLLHCKSWLALCV
ncbi:hypothetical protein K788_0005249 [Paraburkholderia caribensis MBA4]|uniref:Uncharacterized protein n=1 Tax=Paraburkholderia caribensis MBA4 TaxID=1323664 RepID=A0A0P0RG29_9BURK|nr:hypothetical protein K788_0005249 [Paraburkholderia caribensis MBA4]